MSNVKQRKFVQRTLNLNDSNIIRQFLDESASSPAISSYADQLTSSTVTPKRKTPVSRQNSSTPSSSIFKHPQAITVATPASPVENESFPQRAFQELLAKLNSGIDEVKKHCCSQIDNLKKHQDAKLLEVQNDIGSIRQEVREIREDVHQRKKAVPGRKNRKSDDILSKAARELYTVSEDLQFDVDENTTFKSRSNVNMTIQIMGHLKTKFGETFSESRYREVTYNLYRRHRQKYLEADKGIENERKKARWLHNRRFTKLEKRRSVCRTDEERELWEQATAELMSDEEEEEGPPKRIVALKLQWRSASFTARCRMMDNRLISGGRALQVEHIERLSTKKKPRGYSEIFVTA